MKRIRILLAVALAGVLALSAVGCSDKNVAARVNGEVISVEQLDTQVAQLKKQYPQMFEGADGEGRLLDFKQRLLDNLINQELVKQAAEEKGISVSDGDVDKQIEQLKAGFKDDAQFEAAIKQAGMTVETLETQIREQLLTQKLIESLAADGAATEAEIKAYYDKNKTQFFEKEAKRASHILFKPEDKKTAEKVLKEVKDGGEFASLAKQYSADTATAAKGGDLGWPTTPFVPEFQAALDKLKVGQTSALVQTPYGWHIIRVTDERDGSQKKLADVKDQITQILAQQRKADAYQKFLDGLREKAEIEIVLPELKQAASKPGTAPSATTTGSGSSK
jgi:parvulin-like peptidyl-prolyl isomerase